MGRLDKRLQERLLRDRRTSAEAVRAEAEAMEDRAGNVRQLEEAELERFRGELASEAEIRAQSIVRALERAVAPPPPPPQPVQGFDEEDL